MTTQWTPWHSNVIPYPGADDVESRRKGIGSYLKTWWRGHEQLLYAFDDVQFVHMGDAMPAAISPGFKIGVDGVEEATRLIVFYFTQPQVESGVVTFHVIGCVTKKDLYARKGCQIRIRDLHQRANVGYAEFWKTVKKAKKVHHAILEGGEIIERERWAYPGDVGDVESNESLDAKRHLFAFPVRVVGGAKLLSMGYSEVPGPVLDRRIGNFVAGAGWDITVGRKGMWERWDAERSEGDGVHPAALTIEGRGAEAVRLATYFAGTVAAAKAPKPYRDMRAKVEEAYVGYMLDRGGYTRDEMSAVKLLQYNGVREWIEGYADDRDKRAFSRAYPRAAPPVYAGWIPAAYCPPSFLSTRVLRKGKVRFYYMDIEPVVTWLMRVDQLHTNGMAHATTGSTQKMNRAWPWVKQLIRKRADPDDEAFDYDSLANKRARSAAKNKLDLSKEELIAFMPPCMKRMVQAAHSTPRYLRDDERQWMVRFLNWLGFDAHMYADLFRESFDAEQKIRGRPSRDADWKAAWDVDYSFKKGYAQPTCSAVIKNTHVPRTVAKKKKKETTKSVGHCICPYAKSVKHQHPNADIEELVTRTTKHCLDVWKTANPGKVRAHEKPLYYPQQHVYLNMRGRPHVEIKVEGP